MFSKKATKVDKIFIVDLALCKGQIKPEADWGAVDSPKKRTNSFVFLLWKEKQKNKQIRLFVFWENLQRPNQLSVLSDL